MEGKHMAEIRRIKSDRERKIERRRQDAIELRARDIIRESGGARCNCGGPSMGTGHSPDCEYEFASDDAQTQAIDDVWDTITEAREWVIVKQYERLVGIAATAPAEAKNSVQRAAAQYYDIMNAQAQMAADDILVEVIKELGSDPLESVS
jgi:hypothetical protein